MPSKARAKFIQNGKDIDQLWDIHQNYAGEGPGFKRGVDVLNRAALVFITACWESYIEDVTIEAFEFLVKRAKSSSQIPGKVRQLASKKLREDENELKVWDLAGRGWRKVLQDHMDDVKEKWLSNFNTPKSGQVNDLVSSLLGLKNLSKHWRWKGMGAEAAASKLDRYISARGNIAHRIRHDETVYKNWGVDYRHHVTSLVEHTDEAIAEHLESCVGRRSWK